MKRIVLFILMVLVFGFGSLTFGQINGLLTYEFNSRYIFFGGLDFLPDNHSVHFLKMQLTQGNFYGFPYVVTGKNYFEFGAYAEYFFEIEKIRFKSLAFPFGWQFKGEKMEWGSLFGEEISLRAFINPTLGCYYLWVPNIPEWNGYYLFFGANKEILTVNCDLKIGYNKGMCLGEIEGFAHMIGLSKRVDLDKTLSLDVFFRYFWSSPKINKNEPVFGIALNAKLF